jgi:hypothetical protein
MWQVVSGTVNLLGDCDLLAVVQTVAGDGKPYLLHTGWWRPGQTSRADRPRSPCPVHASTAELRDARLIVARELGFPT